MGNLAQRLEVGANVAIIVAACLAVGTWSWYLSRPDSPSGNRPPAPQYAVGDVLPLIGERNVAAGRPTLLLFVASTCHFCTDSMGFYRRLVQNKREHWPGLDFVAASREQPEVLSAYLRQHGLDVDRHVHIAHDSPFKVTLTPTLILLDPQGRVLRIWVGQLSEAAEREVNAAAGTYGAIRQVGQRSVE